MTRLTTLLALALAAVTAASPRPAMNPDSLLRMVGDAADWTVGNYNPKTQSPVRALTKWEYVDCGLPEDAVTLKSLVVDPDPPQAGKKLTVTVSGTVHTLIDDGAYADVVVKLGTFIKLIQKRFDICEELEKANATLQCPIQPGDYEIVQTVDLPREIPKAKFTVDVQAYTQDEDPMACSTIVIDFLRS